MKNNAEFPGLSVRARNILRVYNISSSEELSSALLLKEVDGWRNCGAGTIRELREYVGMPSLIQKTDIIAGLKSELELVNEKIAKLTSRREKIRIELVKLTLIEPLYPEK